MWEVGGAEEPREEFQALVENPTIYTGGPRARQSFKNEALSFTKKVRVTMLLCRYAPPSCCVAVAVLLCCDVAM